MALYRKFANPCARIIIQMCTCWVITYAHFKFFSNNQNAIQRGCMNLHCHQKCVISIHHHHLIFYRKRYFLVSISSSLLKIRLIWSLNMNLYAFPSYISFGHFLLWCCCLTDVLSSLCNLDRNILRYILQIISPRLPFSFNSVSLFSCYIYFNFVAVNLIFYLLCNGQHGIFSYYFSTLSLICIK